MNRMTGIEPLLSHFKTLKYAHHHCGETAQTIYITHTKNACDDKVEREKDKGRCAKECARWTEFARCPGTIDPFFNDKPEIT
jgi:hypothetical protein